MDNDKPAQHEMEVESSEDEDDWGEPEELPQFKQNKKNVARTSVSAEAFGSWNKKEDFQPPVVPKSEETREKIKKRLENSFLFSSLELKEFLIVIEAMKEFRLEKDEKAIVEGDNGDYLYVVEEGELRCTKLFEGNTEPTFFKNYVPGEAFGELALLYNAPRAASITANC